MLPNLSRKKGKFRTRCASCKKKFEISKIKSFTGTHGDFSVTFTKLSVLECPVKHERGYPFKKFGGELMHKVFNSGKLPTLKKSILKKGSYCHRCKAKIKDADINPCKFKMKIEIKYIDPFRVDIVAPSLECPDCGQWQVADRSYYAKIVDAMIDGFRKMGMAPD